MSVLTGFDPELEYAEECYTYLIDREKDRPLYHMRSPELEYREDLIKRIQILCVCHKLSLRVRYLSIFILDFFMDNHHIIEDKLELTLICCLSIAAKVDEMDNKIPKYKELFSEPNQYSSEEILEMESKVLEFFNWVFLIPTAANYIDYFCYKCLDEKQSVKQTVQIYLDKTIETKFYKFYPSIIAASCVYCTRDRFKYEPIWPKYVQNITQYSFNQIKECVSELKAYDFMINTPVMTRVKDNRLNDSGFIESSNFSLIDC